MVKPKAKVKAKGKPKVGPRKMLRVEDWEEAKKQALAFINLEKQDMTVMAGEQRLADSVHKTVGTIALYLGNLIGDLEQKFGADIGVKNVKTAAKILMHTLELGNMVIESLKETPPRTIEDARAYVEGKGEGTYLALLDSDGYLLKTMILDRKKNIAVLSTKFTEETLTVDMKKRIIEIETSEGIIQKQVSVRVEKAEALYPEQSVRVTA